VANVTHRHCRVEHTEAAQRLSGLDAGAEAADLGVRENPDDGSLASAIQR
jgi:hypothetical protein